MFGRTARRPAVVFSFDWIAYSAESSSDKMMPIQWMSNFVNIGAPLVLVFALTSWFLILDERHSRGPGRAYRTLHPIAPILVVMVTLGAGGLAILEFLKDYQAPFETSLPGFMSMVRMVVIASVYVAFSLTLIFFHRAISNINLFTGKRTCRPSYAFYAVLPGTNLAFFPLVLFEAHYYSRSIFYGARVSRRTPAALAIGTFIMFIAAILISLLSDFQDLNSFGSHISTDIALLLFCAAVSFALLFSQIVLEITNLQEALNAHRSLRHDLRHPIAQPNKRNGALLYVAAAVLISAGSTLAVTTFIFSGTLTHQPVTQSNAPPARQQLSPQQRLQAVADRMNKTGRKQLDQVTWLEGVRVEDSVFIYDYSVTVEKLQEDQALSFLRRVQPNIIRGYCTDPSLEVFRELNATLVVSYDYPDGSPLGQINVSLSDCSK